VFRFFFIPELIF